MTASQIRQRKAMGDAAVCVDGWMVIFTTGSGISGCQIRMVKYDQTAGWTAPQIVDPMDGYEFPSLEDAQAYAFERGALKWRGDSNPS